MSPRTGPPPQLGHLLGDFPPELFSDEFFALHELTDAYGLELAVSLFHVLGLGSVLTSGCTVERLRDERGFTDKFDRALGWILSRLTEGQWLECSDARTYRAPGPVPEDARVEIREAALAIEPGSRPTFDLLDAAADIYPRVARGEASGEQLLFEESSKVHLWLDYFDNANALYAVNNWVGAHAAAKRLDRDRSTSVRILEIGAGAGSATQALTGVLHSKGLLDRVEQYTVTEPNPFFRRKGQRALKAQLQRLAPAALASSFQDLDINAPWSDQLDDADAFDLVFGVNVMHLADDLPWSLSQAHGCLKPGGWLVLGECLRPFASQSIWTEFVFQILDGFVAARLHPDYRPNPGFLTVEQWQAALALAGFEGAHASPDAAAIRPIYPRFLTGALCAQAHRRIPPGARAHRWVPPGAQAHR